MKRSVLALALISIFSLQGCDSSSNSPENEISSSSKPLNVPPPKKEFATFDDAHLMAGREIWMETCKGCHATGFAGAPVIGTDAWTPRVKKGKETLYQHALNGFFGPTSTYMPPRGGNNKLTDDEVKSAVDYMVAAAPKE